MNALNAIETETAATETIVKTFKVLDEKLAWFQAQMGKLAKRAAKLGVPAPSYTVGDAVDVPVRKLRHGVDPEAAEIIGPSAYVTVMVRHYPVTVSGTAPKFNGWTLAATLQHLDGGETLIRSIVEEDVPVRYRTAKSDCDHCKAYRKRHDTHLVRHDDGTYKQVGSTCIADFLGGQAPEHFAAQAEFIATALGFGADGEEGFGGVRAERLAGILSFLTWTMASIRANGWLSRSKAKAEDGGGQSTADHVLSMLFPFGPEQEKEAKAFAKSVCDKDGEVAQAALDWALGMEGELNDYLHNCRAIARQGSVEHRTAGYAASIVPTFKRETERLQARKELPESNYVGVVGERVKLTLTVRSVRYCEGPFGATYLYLMNDAAGNDCKWFASNEDLDEGGTYVMMCTVKKHEEYKGRKCTMLSRCAEFVEKPKKNKANKQIAEGVAAFFQGLMMPYHVAQGLVRFVTEMVIAYERYHQDVAWGLQAFAWAVKSRNDSVASGVVSFVSKAVEWYPAREKVGVEGVMKFLSEMVARCREESALVGDGLAAFFQALSYGGKWNWNSYPRKGRW